MAQGDQAALSFSFVEDIWHLLTVEMSMFKVLLLEISVEIFLILCTAIILTLLAHVSGAADDSHETTGSLFVFKLLLSLSTVRLSTDSVWGWREGPVSPPLEVIILSLHSWFHWLLLNIASAIVVARAMRPLRQVFFSSDCVVDHEYLNIRLQILRFKTVRLKNLHISLSATTKDGVFHNLPLSNNDNGNIPEWRGAGSMNIKHSITPASPLHPTNLAKKGMNMIRVALSATDSNGLPVNETMSWYDAEAGVFMKGPSQRAFREKGVKFPQILYKAKWRDAYNMFKPWPPSKLPAISVDINNFNRAVVSNPPEPEIEPVDSNV
ncbi:hypothetical protein TL16_g11326 [Triparma laevis f. inornata]|uniref:Uncharacterized protein n=2 Tax=Triparma laevis TaxID=1534972 RepID=A0A9W6ZZA5_9STRA|nr:hypothetical protein TrLO_g13773 [Triparma laevis f. longispina]GMH89000.1 hypothetical protein TL16_g11326 [Triparma laevis f. inornata]